MKTIVKPRAAAASRYRANQITRRRLIDLGVDPARVMSTSDTLLPDLLRSVEATLFDLVDDTDAVEPVVMVPALRLVPDELAETPDEAESTRYFLERIKRGPGVVIDLFPTGIGGSEFGGSAA